MKHLYKITLTAAVFSLAIWVPTARASSGNPQHAEIPRPLDTYGDARLESVSQVLANRVKQEPFNLAASLMFLCAIAHTFAAGKFTRLSHRLEHRHSERLKREGRTADAKPYDDARDDVSFPAVICHFLGEVEVIFGIWLIPLAGAIIHFHGWPAVTGYFDWLFKEKYTEPFFVIVIMAIASTRPVLKFSENCMKKLARFGGETPAAWWLSILTAGPLLGSFITEPAAMTICALLLAKQFYSLKPSPKFCYATLGVLFVNISVGGTLTHFAAPPVLMVAGKWGFDMAFMFTHFGWKAVTGIALSTGLYYFLFRNELAGLKEKAEKRKAAGLKSSRWRDREDAIPFWVTGAHLLFMAWTVMNLHHPPLFLGGFLFFLAFAQATEHYQNTISIRPPLLVGFFLAGLVTHGVLQQWWLAPVLGSLREIPLFIGAIVLTAFNDNAAITFLCSQVPAFDANGILQYAVVAGAVTGGGLTVIANAPNPAGYSILYRHFKGGISPAGLLLGAITPTIILAFCFMLL